MQVGILRQLQDPSALTARVLETLETARGAGGRVFFLRHLSLPVELAGGFQPRQAMVWWPAACARFCQLRRARVWQRVARATDVRPWFLRDTPGFELLPELAPRSSEAI